MASSWFPFARRARAGRVILASLLLALTGFASSARADTVVSLTFDDGIASQLDAAAMLEAHGMRGTFYINSGNIASKAYFMTWSQLDGLAAAGHEIAGHTIDHKRLTDLTADQQRAEICDDAATLRGHGYSITDFAYPFGAGSTQSGVLSALHDCGYASARKVGELSTDPGCGPTCPAAETLQPANPYGVRSAPLPAGAISLSDLESWVTTAESTGAGWLPIVFHDICDGCTASSVSAQDFSAFLDWLSLRAAQGTVVKTVRQALAEGPLYAPPTTAISCNGTTCAGKFFKSPVSLTLSATDAGGGIGATRYTLDGSDPTPSSAQYTPPFTVGATTTVKFRTWDLTGNPEPIRTQVVSVDDIPPTAQVTSPVDGASLYQAPLTVSVDASDVGSRVSDVQLFVDGNYFASASGASSPYRFTVPASMLAVGSHRLKALVIDAAGNKTSSALVTITIRDGTPTTAVACGGGACPTSFVKGPLSVSLSATDGGAGISATRYTLDGTDPTATSTAYTAPFTLTDSATVKARSWDTFGNPGPVRSQALKIDAVPPTGQIVSPMDGASVPAGALPVTVNAADAGAGVVDVELFVDGNYVDYSRSKSSPYGFTLPAGSLSLGSHKIKAYLADALGNHAFTAPITVTVKDGTPTTTIACDGGACPTNYVKGPVSVSLSATDGGAGIGATRYTLDGSDPTSSSAAYSAPFTLTGTATVKFRSWDLAGNAEPVRTQALKIDAVAPAAQIASPADGASVLAGNSLTVTVNATDSGSGVTDVELFVDGNYVDYSRFKSSPYGITLAAGSLSLGSHKIKAYVEDALGNHVFTAPITVNLKDGLPTTTIACDGGACPTGYVKGPVSVSLAATDGGAGISATRYTLDGTDPSVTSPPYSAPFSLTGTTTVKFRSWDLAGNPEPVRAQTLKIDAVAPTGQIVSPVDGASVLAAADLTVTVSAADAGAGVTDVELFVDGNYVDYSRNKSSPYGFTLPAGSLSLGSHRLKAYLADALGNHSWTAPITVVVG